MGADNDASSSAALGAQDEIPEAATRRPGLFERLTGALTSNKSHSTDDFAGIREPMQPVPHASGLSILHSKRVEDVAIPRADVVAVPIDIALDELVKVFRESRTPPGRPHRPTFAGLLLWV